MTSKHVGATLMSVLAAVEALVSDILARNQFFERPVEGNPGGGSLLFFGLDYEVDIFRVRSFSRV